MKIFLLALVSFNPVQTIDLQDNAKPWGDYFKCLYGSLHTTTIAGVPETKSERRVFAAKRLQDCLPLRAGAVQSLVNLAEATGHAADPAKAERKIMLIDKGFTDNVVEPEVVRQRREDLMKCVKTKGWSGC